MKKNKKGGFTLLELLIVIAILAILSVALVIVLNPAETLKKARDAQRISDLSTIKTAIGLYLTSVSNPTLDNLTGTTAALSVCTTTTTSGVTATAPKIRYSVAVAPTTISGTLAAGADSLGPTWVAASGLGTAVASASKVDGSGWIPVNFAAIVGGSPISNIPVDPVNTVTATAAVTDLAYRYACQNSSNSATKPAYVYEIDAVLESNAYTVTDNKMASDGGDHDSYYETGSSLKLLPATGGIF